MRGPSSFVLVAVAALGLASGCGPTFDGAVYHGQGFAFRVGERPAAWQAIQAEGTAVAFRDAAASATIAVNGRCGKDAEDVPLAALTRHLFIQFTDREASVEEVVPFDGREALHTVMTAKLDGVPKKFDVWVLKKDGCVYDLYMIVAPDRFESCVGEFRKFVGGFATVAGDG